MSEGREGLVIEMHAQHLKMISLSTQRSPHILLTMGLLSLIHYSWSLFGNKAATHTRQNNRLTTFY